MEINEINYNKNKKLKKYRDKAPIYGSAFRIFMPINNNFVQDVFHNNVSGL